MTISRLAFYHLETLICIARLGTFGAAAERLNTTQPAISARVREMEAHIGTTLFRREGRTMTLTPAGRRIVKESEPLLASFQGVLQSSSDLAEASGIVRIGAGEIAAASCLPGFVSDLQRDLPNVSLEIEIALTADLIQQILNGRMDLVFGAGRIAHPALKTTSIGFVDLLWLASPETVEKMRHQREKKHFPIWSLSSHSPLYQIMRDAISQSGMSSRSVNLCNNARSMIDIVMSGNGVGIFPHTMVQQEISARKLVPIPNAVDMPPVEFQVAIRAAEMDPLILSIFDRASTLDVRASRSPLHQGGAAPITPQGG
jgi:DNA-binding transcriptional LysR family regulator